MSLGSVTSLPKPFFTGMLNAPVKFMEQIVPDVIDRIRDTMHSIKEYEENVRLSRMTFNDTVTRFNQQVRVFPASLVASMLGFAKRDYLADDVSKKDYPTI